MSDKEIVRQISDDDNDNDVTPGFDVLQAGASLRMQIERQRSGTQMLPDSRPGSRTGSERIEPTPARSSSHLDTSQSPTLNLELPVGHSSSSRPPTAGDKTAAAAAGAAAAVAAAAELASGSVAHGFGSGSLEASMDSPSRFGAAGQSGALSPMPLSMSGDSMDSPTNSSPGQQGGMHPGLGGSSSSRHTGNTEVENKLKAMRERFRMLQMMEDMDKDKAGGGGETDSLRAPADLLSSPAVATPSTVSGTSPSALASPATHRWGKLRKVVNSKAHFVTWNEHSLPILAHKSFKGLNSLDAKPDGDLGSNSGSSKDLSALGVGGAGNVVPEHKEVGQEEVPIEVEDVQLMEFWNSLEGSLESLQPTKPKTGLISSFSPSPGAVVKEDDEAGEGEEKHGGVEGGEEGDKEEKDGGTAEEKRVPELALPPEEELRAVEGDFEAKAEVLGVTVNRVPEEVVAERRRQIEQEIRAQQQLVKDRILQKEADVAYREEDARERLKEREAEARHRLAVEKQKVAAMALEKERALGKDFRRVREKLEAGVKRQQGAIDEKFGHMLVHEESLARRFAASTSMAPQPIEMRIHMMRAVKTKLPKGAYVLMLTQYDSLGGRPLSWSQVGSNGIGDLRPGITRIFKHYGRYFDRMLRVEDSVFALCPPKPLLKPNYVFVLELFELASRTNPMDKIVAWTALPMVYESMTLVEGKVKLPMLHGEHSQSVQLFKDMEKSMAQDLHVWLANIYIEIRHMSLAELGATEEMLKTTDFDLDYFNKSMMPVVEPGEGDRGKASDDDDLEAGTGGATAGAGAGAGGQVKDTDAGSENSFRGSSQQDSSIAAAMRSLLPVDKGIFRRRLRTRKSDAGDDEGGVDHSEGDNSGAGAGAGAVSMLKKTDSDDEQAPLLARKKGEHGITSPRAPGLMRQVSRKDGNSFRHKAMLAAVGGPSGLSAPGLMRQESRKDGNSFRHKAMLTGVGGPSGLSGVTVVSKRSNVSAGSRAKPLLLKNDNNFLEHRKELVRRWKENAQSKMANAGELDDELFDEVRERGYNVADESYLHKQQRGKLAGLETVEDRDDKRWAGAGLEGKIVRRHQSEGPRFDSEAIFDPYNFVNSKGSPRHRIMGVGALSPRSVVSGGPNVELGPDGKALPPPQPFQHFSIHRGWQELRDAREMEDYTMAVAADPNQRKRLMPGAKARSKLRYMTYEMFGDFSYYLWGTFEFYMSILMYLFSLWIRIYVHYIAQYLYLLSLGTPVFGFELRALEVQQKYMSSSISVAAEVGVVAIGPIANVCTFLVLVILGTMFYWFTDYMPEVFSKFFAAFGLASILDPLLVIVIDLIFHNYDCENKNKDCEEDYTSSDCRCFNGDFLKLWYRMEDEEGSGLSGLFIMLLLYMGTGICASLILYYYIVHVHRDGKVLDQWRRINGAPSEFFIPLDFEVSSDEMQETIDKSLRWRGPKGARRKLQVSTIEHVDGLSKRYIINEVESNGQRSVFRQFQMEPSGVIVELFEDTKANLAAARRGIFMDDVAAPRPVTAEAFQASLGVFNKGEMGAEGTYAEPPPPKLMYDAPPPLLEGAMQGERFDKASALNDDVLSNGGGGSVGGRSVGGGGSVGGRSVGGGGSVGGRSVGGSGKSHQSGGSGGSRGSGAGAGTGRPAPRLRDKTTSELGVGLSSVTPPKRNMQSDAGAARDDGAGAGGGRGAAEESAHLPPQVMSPLYTPSRRNLYQAAGEMHDGDDGDAEQR